MKRKARQQLLRLPSVTYAAYLLAACGSEKQATSSTTKLKQENALPSYDFDQLFVQNRTYISDDTDIVNDIGSVDKADPYWITSLEMEHYYLISDYFEANSRVIFYAFPQEMPTYFDKITDERGWRGVTPSVETATVEILSQIEDIINITFEPTLEIKQPFVVSVMSNEQGSSDA